MEKLFPLMMLMLTFSASSAIASGFTKVGSYLLEYSIFKVDVYQITYFKGQDAEKLVLDYKIAVKKKYSQEGWKIGLQHRLKDQEYGLKVQWLLDNTDDMLESDQLVILREGDRLQILKNDKLIAMTKDENIAKLAFEPWLGSNPISVELKNALLGQSID